MKPASTQVQASPLPDRQEDPQAGPRKATFGQAMTMVFWSFFGVRKRSDHERDASQLKPLHVVVAAVIGVAVFVLVLLSIVHSVVR